MLWIGVSTTNRKGTRVVDCTLSLTHRSKLRNAFSKAKWRERCRANSDSVVALTVFKLFQMQFLNVSKGTRLLHCQFGCKTSIRNFDTVISFPSTRGITAATYTSLVLDLGHSHSVTKLNGLSECTPSRLAKPAALSSWYSSALLSFPSLNFRFFDIRVYRGSSPFIYSSASEYRLMSETLLAACGVCTDRIVIFSKFFFHAIQVSSKRIKTTIFGKIWCWTSILIGAWFYSSMTLITHSAQQLYYLWSLS